MITDLVIMLINFKVIGKSATILGKALKEMATSTGILFKSIETNLYNNTQLRK